MTAAIELQSGSALVFKWGRTAWSTMFANVRGAKESRPVAKSDAALLADVQVATGGDGDAYSRIIRRYQDSLARRMIRFTRDPRMIEELVHDVFVEAYFALPGYRGDAPFEHWLQRIATRVGYRFWTRRGREPAAIDVHLHDLPADSDESARDSAEEVAVVLAKLAPRDRLILTLLYLESRSVAEAADLAGWSETMVKVQAPSGAEAIPPSTGGVVASRPGGGGRRWMSWISCVATPPNWTGRVRPEGRRRGPGAGFDSASAAAVGTVYRRPAADDRRGRGEFAARPVARTVRPTSGRRNAGPVGFAVHAVCGDSAMNEVHSSEVSQPLPPPATNRRRWLTVLLALVVFVAGMASGAALTVRFAVHRLQFAIHHPEVAPARIAATLRRRLDLDATQTAQVEKILAKRQVEITAIRRKLQPEIKRQLDAVRDEVAAVLTESQRERWQELFDQFQERWLPPPPPDAR